MAKIKRHSNSPRWLNNNYNFMLTAWWLIHCENVSPVVTSSADAFGKNTSILSNWHVLFCYYCTEHTIYNTRQELQSLQSFFSPLFIKRPNAKIFHPNSQYSVLEKLQCCPMKVIIKVSLISIMFPVTGFLSNILSGWENSASWLACIALQERNEVQLCSLAQRR